MKCGAKCFTVKFEIKGKIKVERVISRTPVSARKVIRQSYGKAVNILTVK